MTPRPPLPAEWDVCLADPLEMQSCDLILAMHLSAVPRPMVFQSRLHTRALYSD